VVCINKHKVLEDLQTSSKRVLFAHFISDDLVTGLQMSVIEA